jgi:TolB protein
VRDSTPTLEATSTPTPRPVRRTPQPTSQPELTGKLIVHTRNGGEFYTINADGTDLRRITDGEDATWSPDGRRIAFARWREPRGVWVVNADGSEEQRVFAWSDARWPSWSPDSTQILFSRQYGGRTDEVQRCFRGFCFTIPAQPHWKLGIIGLNGGAFDEPPGPDLSLAPSWAPSGKDIVYAGQNGLWVQSPDRAVSYQLTQDARDTSPAWSPDGSRVAFSRHQHDHWEIYVVDAGGHNLKRLTDTPVRFDGVVGNSVAAAWSPNGQYIAFLTDRTEKWEVWVMRADGRDQKPMLGQALSGLPLDYAFAGERALSWTY